MKRFLKYFLLILFALMLAYIFIGDFRTWLNKTIFYVQHPDIVGGPCGPNCEGIYEYPKNKALTNIDTLPDFNEDYQDRMLLTGTIYTYKGQPAKDVILYIYHANSKGVYPFSTSDNTKAAAVHGHLRGWIKTNSDGKYYFYTTRPGRYPANTLRAHIHVLIKEPGVNEYMLRDCVFPDDSLIMNEEINTPQSENGGLLQQNSDSTYPVWLEIFTSEKIFIIT